MIAAQESLIRVLALCCAGIALQIPAQVFAASPDQDEPAAAQQSPQDNPAKPVVGTAKEVYPAEPQYRIGVEDVLLISVWRDADLTREVPVRPDGKISLPLIQDIAAAGKTPAELGHEIQVRLKEFMSNPSVTVVVREINSIKIYLLGEVARPGPVTPKSQVRLLQAISMAGGITPFGGKKKIVIFRKTPSGEKAIEVSYEAIISGKKPDDDLVLQSGDTVVVR
jgi:polysaccharide export outer membrane protein